MSSRTGHAADGILKFPSSDGKHSPNRTASRKRTPAYASNFAKFQAATGWTPKVPMRDGVRRLHEWLCESRSTAAAGALATA